MANPSKDCTAQATHTIGLTRSIRIGLLTPYSGCNLGDGAIQESVKSAILRRFPDAHIIMLTADPMNTEYLHGLVSFPMTGIYISGYSATIVHSNRNRSGRFKRDQSSLKERVRGNPLTNLLIGGPFRIGRILVRTIRHVVSEALHIARAYALVRNLDLLIVSGGGQFDDYWGGAMAHPYTLAKWGWLARISGCKYIIMSVGVGKLSNTLSRIFSAMALRSASYRSFRDEGSKNMLGFSGVIQNDSVLPDLAFSYPASPAIFANTCVLRETPLKVGIAPIGYLSKYGWPEENEKLFDQYFKTLCRFCEWLIEHSWNIELFYTDVPDDTVVDCLADHLNNIFRGQKGPVAIARFANPQELVVGLSSFDVVVASRLHAVILSHALGIPVLAISYERKVETHMADVKQKDFSVDIHHLNLQEVIAGFENVVKHREIIAADLREIAVAKRDLLDRQYDRLFGYSGKATVDCILATENSRGAALT